MYTLEFTEKRKENSQKSLRNSQLITNKWQVTHWRLKLYFYVKPTPIIFVLFITLQKRTVYHCL